MRVLLRVIAYCCLVFIFMMAAILFFGISNKPDLTLDWAMTQADVARAKKILLEGSKIKPHEMGTLELNKEDINLAGNYLLNRFRKGRVEISLKPNKLKFMVTAVLPENILGKYLNITFRLGNEDGSNIPTITKFKAGVLLLPSSVAAVVLKNLIRYTRLNEYFILATEPIKAVVIDAEKIAITYNPNRAALDTARDILTHNNDTSTIDTSIYKVKIAEIVQLHDSKWRLSLADLIKPLFALAYQRSSEATAIDENRTVINIINDYVNNTKGEPKPISPYYPAYLYKRIDLAQHFIGSAAITASVNSQMAQMLGEEKELRDAQGGTGFSFVDLTADKAGTRFGELATASPASARKLQAFAANIKDYKDFMPDPRMLPEHMDEAEFKQRYGSIKSDDYDKVSKQIDVLIAETPIFKHP